MLPQGGDFPAASMSALPAIDGVDLERLGAWMDAQGLPRGAIQRAEPLAGGSQNILLRIERGGAAYVLRRPPLHKRPNSDETMRREARVLAALAGSAVPHPGLIAACPDESLLGGAFYLMEPVDGFGIHAGLPEPHRRDAALRHRMGLAMAEGIAELGAVDWRAAGLGDFGRVEGYPGHGIPEAERVAAWLEAERPAQWTPGILHGDYHMANVMFSNTSGELAAIIDWELCTIGDPLLDLGWLLATWADPDGGAAMVGVQPWEGFATRDELVAAYEAASGRSVAALAPWYTVLACYKLGILLEGTYARACAGKAPKQIGELLHRQTLALFERAIERIDAP